VREHRETTDRAPADRDFVLTPAPAPPTFDATSAGSPPPRASTTGRHGNHDTGFVSLLSDEGVPVEQIARRIGHAGGSAVTETVYRQQLRSVVDDGAIVMDRFHRLPSWSFRPGR
jgi:hypothetical protein